MKNMLMIASSPIKQKYTDENRIDQFWQDCRVYQQSKC